MGKLDIVHHKSYHLYRRDNVERVRKDEEDAWWKEVDKDGMMADSEARIDLLRGKSAILDKIEKKRRRDDDDLKDLAANGSNRGPVPTTNGRTNLEQSSLTASTKAAKKVIPTETEKGAQDLKHWFSERTREQPAEVQDERRKYIHDLLTSKTKQSATRPSASTSSSSYRPPLPPKANHDKPSEVQARLSSSSTERELALDLMRRKKREMEGKKHAVAVPQSMHGQGGQEVDLELVSNKCDECLKGNRLCLRPKGKERCEACAKSKKKCTLVSPRQSLKKGKGREHDSAADSDQEPVIRIGPPKPKKRKIVRDSPEGSAPQRVEVSVASRGRRQPSPPVLNISSPSVVESDSEPIPNVSAPHAPISPANSLQPPAPSSTSAPSTDDLQLHIRILQTEVDASQRELHAMREAQILQLERREEEMAAQFARKSAIYQERIRDLSQESEPLRRRIAELEAEVSRLKSARVR